MNDNSEPDLIRPRWRALLRPRPPPSLAEVRARSPHPERRSGGCGSVPSSGVAPLVSVVTVCRNAVTTLGATIESVRAQQYPHVEHIVVDGASTDGTVALLEARNDQLARWISEPDAGIADGFNKGIGLATGSIIALLNADDTYEPDAIARSVAALAARPEAGFSFGDMVQVDGHGQRVVILGGEVDYSRVIERRMPMVNHPTFFVRHEVYERFGLFRTDYRVAMDYDFVLRLHLGGVTGVHVPLVVTRMTLGGVSTRLVRRGYAEVLRSAITQTRAPVGPLAEYAVCVAGNLVKTGLEGIGATELVSVLERWRYRTLRRHRE